MAAPLRRPRVQPVWRRQRTLKASAVAVTLFIAVALLAPSDAAAQDETGLLSTASSGSEVWAATLTVGSDGGRLGYGSPASSRTVGALSSNVFTWRGATYTVGSVLYQGSRGPEGTWSVVFDVAPPLPDGPRPGRVPDADLVRDGVTGFPINTKRCATRGSRAYPVDRAFLESPSSKRLAFTWLALLNTDANALGGSVR